MPVPFHGLTMRFLWVEAACLALRAAWMGSNMIPWWEGGGIENFEHKSLLGQAYLLTPTVSVRQGPGLLQRKWKIWSLELCFFSYIESANWKGVVSKRYLEQGSLLCSPMAGFLNVCDWLRIASQLCRLNSSWLEGFEKKVLSNLSANCCWEKDRNNWNFPAMKLLYRDPDLSCESLAYRPLPPALRTSEGAEWKICWN